MQMTQRQRPFLPVIRAISALRSPISGNTLVEAGGAEGGGVLD